MSAFWWLALMLACALAGCANPVPPTGGPPDRDPPRIVAAVPDTNAVGVTEGTLRLTFSEAVDQRSLAGALTIVPEPDAPPRLKWDGRTVEIDVGALRDSTTYVVTLDNTFRDARGVALASPLTFAFSTGPTLNRGRLAGTVRDPATGAGIAGVDVFAYDADEARAALPPRPLYRTQTTSEGRFAFQYLGETPLFVVALRDANRNRRLDPDEAYALPPAPALAPDSVAVDMPWLLARPDTTAPSVERVRSYSAVRHALRLSEPVARFEAGWQLSDSSGTAFSLQALYLSDVQPREVFFATPPLAPGRYTLRFGAIADSVGNVLPGGVETLVPSSGRDTFGLRFEGFVPAGGVLQPGAQAGVRFSLPLPDSLRATLVTTPGADSVETPVALLSGTGTTYLFSVRDTLTAIVHADRIGGTRAAQTFVAPGTAGLGGIEGFVAAPDATAVVVEIHGEGGFSRQANADSTGRFRFPDLLPGDYRLRAFIDQNGNGRWDGGTLAPFRSAEPVRWAAEPINVRARWDNALPDTLRFE